MELLSLNNNQSCYFLVPLLFSKDTKSSQIFNENFKNAYIADFKKIQHDDKVLLVYNKYSIDIPVTTRDDKYKFENNDVLVYKIPEEFSDDYGKFLRGEWSKISDNAKKLILSFWDQDGKSLLFGILHKTITPGLKSFYSKLKVNPKKDFQKDEEYWYNPQLTKEVLGL
jgi:hypothetical protein